MCCLACVLLSRHVETRKKSCFVAAGALRTQAGMCSDPETTFLSFPAPHNHGSDACCGHKTQSSWLRSGVLPRYLLRTTTINMEDTECGIFCCISYVARCARACKLRLGHRYYRRRQVAIQTASRAPQQPSIPARCTHVVVLVPREFQRACSIFPRNDWDFVHARLQTLQTPDSADLTFKAAIIDHLRFHSAWEPLEYSVRFQSKNQQQWQLLVTVGCGKWKNSMLFLSAIQLKMAIHVGSENRWGARTFGKVVDEQKEDNNEKIGPWLNQSTRTECGGTAQLDASQPGKEWLDFPGDKQT